MDDPKYLAALKAAGFDSIVPAVHNQTFLIPMAREARRLGMRMLVIPGGIQNRNRAETDAWPMEAWYLQDEPDVLKTPPEKLEALSREIRRWDPGRLQYINIGQGSAAQLYGGIADILSVDWYPVPHRKLDSVADEIDEACKYLPPGKPLWMILQAFNWRDNVPVIPKMEKIGRFPDFQEIRFMTYLSIVHGAKGLFYFNFLKPGGKNLLDVPEEWQALSRVVREIKALQVILERGRPIPVPFALGTKGLEGKAWRWRGRDYVILLNRAGSPARVPSEVLRPIWRVLFETRRDSVEALLNMAGSYFLESYQVLILESRLHFDDAGRT